MRLFYVSPVLIVVNLYFTLADGDNIYLTYKDYSIQNSNVVQIAHVRHNPCDASGKRDERLIYLEGSRDATHADRCDSSSGSDC